MRIGALPLLFLQIVSANFIPKEESLKNVWRSVRLELVGTLLLSQRDAHGPGERDHQRLHRGSHPSRPRISRHGRPIFRQGTSSHWSRWALECEVHPGFPDGCSEIEQRSQVHVFLKRSFPSLDSSSNPSSRDGGTNRMRARGRMPRR